MSRNPDTNQHGARSGTRTETTDAQSQSQSQASDRDPQQSQVTGTLRLRGHRTETNTEGTQERRIRWAEEVVDNEGQGKKSSKGKGNRSVVSA